MRSRHGVATLILLTRVAWSDPPPDETARWLLVGPSRSDQEEPRRTTVLLLIFFECLICLFIWWRGVVIALGNQPQHRSWDMLQRQRRADWARNELEQRPWWWLLLSGLMLLVMADWFVDKWQQPPWRAAILWTVGMGIVLVVVVAITEHFGWGIKPIRV
jgi:hypothetical protein